MLHKKEDNVNFAQFVSCFVKCLYQARKERSDIHVIGVSISVICFIRFAELFWQYGMFWFSFHYLNLRIFIHPYVKQMKYFLICHSDSCLIHKHDKYLVLGGGFPGFANCFSLSLWSSLELSDDWCFLGCLVLVVFLHAFSYYAVVFLLSYSEQIHVKSTMHVIILSFVLYSNCISDLQWLTNYWTIYNSGYTILCGNAKWIITNVKSSIFVLNIVFCLHLIQYLCQICLLTKPFTIWQNNFTMGHSHI
jgi:hypothetical protein